MGNVNWKSGVTGDWTTVGDWTSATIPTASDAAIVGAGSTSAYSLSIAAGESVAASSLTVADANATVTDSGSLTLGTALNVNAGNVTVDTNGALNWANGTGVIGVSGGSTLHFTGTHTLDNTQINMGTANNTTAFLTFDQLTLGVNTTVNFSAGSQTPTGWNSSFQQVTGGTLNNNGTIQAVGGGASGLIFTNTLNNNGLLLNSGSNGYTVEAYTLNNTGTIEASGTGGIGISAFTSFVNSGHLIDNGGMAISSVNFVNNGTIDVGAGNGYLAIDFSNIWGNGAINLNGGSTDVLEFLTGLGIGNAVFESGTINLNGNGATITNVTPATNGTNTSSGTTTLSWAGVVNHNSASATIGTGIINEGTINASHAGGALNFNSSAFENDGTINVSNGDTAVFGMNSTLLGMAMPSGGAVIGNGMVTLASGGIADFKVGDAAQQLVDFLPGTNSVLETEYSSAFAAQIVGFAQGDVIRMPVQLGAGNPVSATWTAANGLDITFNGGNHQFLALRGDYTGATFKVTSGAAGYDISLASAPTTDALGGQFVNASGVEGLAANRPIAAFNVSTLGDTAAGFSAVITYADHTTALGVVSGANGVFTVTDPSGHAITDEGALATSVSITRLADNRQIVVSGTLTGTEGDVLSGVAGSADFSATAGQTFSGTVGTFTDVIKVGNPADFAATIDWGDGTSSVGTLSLDANGNLAVAGTHAYAANGSDAVSVTINETTGTASATLTGTATVGGGALPPPPALGGAVTLASTLEDQAIAPVTVIASFTDTNLSTTAADYLATIDWGDGTISTGTVSGANGSFSVTDASGHVYGSEGSYAASVTINNIVDATSIALAGSVTATEADVLASQSAPALTATVGQTISGTVASFTNTNLAATAGDFSATINWGDGSSSAGTVNIANGVISVDGSHAYAAAGADAVTVTLNDVDGTATATAAGTAKVTSALSGSFSLAAATEGAATSVAVANFTDTDLTTTGANYTAKIIWGDGTTSVGTVSGANGVFSVAAPAGHVYGAEGSYAASVAITSAAGDSLTVGGAVTAAEGDVLAAQGAISLSATAGTSFSGTVAKFTDSFAANKSGDFAATINWGDGTTSAGTVSLSGGVATVSGAHTYAAAGTDVVSVVLKDVDGVASATATGTATVTTASSGTTFQLTTGKDNFTGGAGNDLFIATAGTLSTGDKIDGGAGVNQLTLSGGGAFDLRKPTTLANIQTIQAQEGVGTDVQTVNLRDGLTVTLNVADSLTAGSSIRVTGANDSSVLNLGSGNDIVTVGAATETINAGAGDDTVNVTVATIGAKIDGGTGNNTLVVIGGGKVVMGSNVTNIQNVGLMASGNNIDFTANATVGLLVNDLSSGQSDIIRAGATGQTLSGGYADQTFVGFGSGSTKYKDSAAAFNGSTIKNFTAGDVIDISKLAFGANTTLGYSASGANGGDLNVFVGGALQTQIHLFGQFSASTLGAKSDGAGGTLITDTLAAKPVTLAVVH